MEQVFLSSNHSFLKYHIINPKTIDIFGSRTINLQVWLQTQGKSKTTTVSSMNRIPFYDKSPCRFLLLKVGYVVLNLLEISFKLKVNEPGSTQSLLKRDKGVAT